MKILQNTKNLFDICNQKGEKKLISFVLPIFNEEENIPKLWQELQILDLQIEKKFDCKCQFIFVNDGSWDNSFDKLKNIYLKNSKKVVVINFSKNFGHQIAVTAGQNYAIGEAVIIMDTDLQDPPSVCLDLINQYYKGFDVVYAQRKNYKTDFIKQTSAFLFYRILKRITNVDIPVDTGDFRLISQRVNSWMNAFPEKARFLRGISSLIGFKQTAVKFDRQERYKGKPQYTFLKSLKLALDGITGFSVFPLQLIGITGIFLAFSSFLIGILYVLFTILTSTNISGWASLFLTIVFFGGIQLITLGVIGEYTGRIYTQVINRPLYIIDEILKKEKK